MFDHVTFFFNVYKRPLIFYPLRFFILHDPCTSFYSFPQWNIISFPSQWPESTCYKLHNDRRPCWSGSIVTQWGQASFLYQSLYLLDPLSLRLFRKAQKHVMFFHSQRSRAQNPIKNRTFSLGQSLPDFFHEQCFKSKQPKFYQENLTENTYGSYVYIKHK